MQKYMIILRQYALPDPAPQVGIDARRLQRNITILLLHNNNNNNNNNKIHNNNTATHSRTLGSTSRRLQRMSMQ